MPHQLTDTVKILQKCAVWSGDKILLLQRATDAHSRPGQWDLPGGNAEWPTTDTDAPNPHIADIVREVVEETGFTIELTPDAQPVHISSYFEAQKQVYTVILGWKYELDTADQPAPQLSSEHTAFVWISPEELSNYDCGFAGGESGFITKILERSR